MLRYIPGPVAPLPAFFTVVIVNYNSGGCLARCLSGPASPAFPRLHGGRRRQRLDRRVGRRRWGICRRDGSRSGSIAMPASPRPTTTLRARRHHPGWRRLNPDAFAEPGLARPNDARDPALSRRRRPSDRFRSTPPRPAGSMATGDVYHATGLLWRGGFGQPLAHQRGEGEISRLVVRQPFIAARPLPHWAGFDEDFFCYAEDVDLGFRLRLAGHRSIQLANAVVRHVGGASGGGRERFRPLSRHAQSPLARRQDDARLAPSGCWRPSMAVITWSWRCARHSAGRGRESPACARRRASRARRQAWRKRRLIQRARRASLLAGDPPVAALPPLRRRPFLRPTEDAVTLKPATAERRDRRRHGQLQHGPGADAGDRCRAWPIPRSSASWSSTTAIPRAARRLLARRAAAEPRLLRHPGAGQYRLRRRLQSGRAAYRVRLSAAAQSGLRAAAGRRRGCCGRSCGAARPALLGAVRWSDSAGHVRERPGATCRASPTSWAKRCASIASSPAGRGSRSRGRCPPRPPPSPPSAVRPCS